MINELIKFLIDHLEGLASSVSIIFALHVFLQGNKDKKTEIYLKLFEQKDEIWGKITAHPETNTNLFHKDINDIPVQDENLMYNLFQLVSLLSRVHYYYEKSNQDILKSNWHKEIQYIMSKKLFISAFNRWSNRYDDKFNLYINKILHPSLANKSFLDKIKEELNK